MHSFAISFLHLFTLYRVLRLRLLSLKALSVTRYAPLPPFVRRFATSGNTSRTGLLALFGKIPQSLRDEVKDREKELDTMYALLARSLLLAAYAEAAGLRFERRGEIDNGTNFTNSSTLFTTSTALSSSSTSTWSTSSSPGTSATTTSSDVSIVLNSTTSSLTSDSTSTLQANTPYPFNNVTASNTTTPQPTCDGTTATFSGAAPVVVTVTVTTDYQTTVTANQSVSLSDIYVTPLTACASTIVPLQGPLQPLATIAVTSTIVPAAAPAPSSFSVEASVGGGGRPQGITNGIPGALSTEIPALPSGNPKNPLPPPLPPAAATPQVTVVESTIYASAPYTSTVTVTKKTPNPVTVTANSPPPNFQQPTSPKPANPQGTPKPANPPPPPGPPSPAGVSLNPGPATGTPRPGNVVASVAGSQNIAPVPVVVPTATLAGVGVAVLPSTVVIGSHFIAIPAPKASQTVVTDHGVAFTVRPSEVVASSGTVSFGVQQQLASITPAPQVVTVAPGLVVTVGASTAVVGGTTYKFGGSIPATTVTVSGHKITINSFGVVMPSTTVSAEAMTAAPTITETAGGLTFTVEGSVVVISGSTFRIGSSVSPYTETIGSQKVSFGPNGIGLKTTTLQPLQPTKTPKSGSRTSTGGATFTAISSAAATGAASNTVQSTAFLEVVGWLLSALVLL